MEDHIENSTCLQMKPECKREGSARLKDPSQHTKFNHPSADEQGTLESVPTVDRHSRQHKMLGYKLNPMCAESPCREFQSSNGENQAGHSGSQL